MFRTISNVIKRVTNAICHLKDNLMYIHRNDELEMVLQGFYNIASFPRVLLVVDGTHVRIQSPGGELAETFTNRKGWFS